jgi:hypothetical protein
LSSSINGSPILAMLSCVWNESHKLEAREYDSAARMGWWALCASNDFPTLHDPSFCIRDKVRAIGVAAPGAVCVSSAAVNTTQLMENQIC